MEAVVAEFAPALRAHKMIGVPRLVQRRYATLNMAHFISLHFIDRIVCVYVFNRSVAVGAPRREQVMVVVFAVRLPRSLEEVPMAQLFAALRTHVVLWVPHLTERDHHLKFFAQECTVV